MPVVSKIHIVRKQLAGCGIKGNQSFAVEGDAGGGLRDGFSNQSMVAFDFMIIPPCIE